MHLRQEEHLAWQQSRAAQRNTGCTKQQQQQLQQQQRRQT
jgi:hypothetical protein